MGSFAPTPCKRGSAGNAFSSYEKGSETIRIAEAMMGMSSNTIHLGTMESVSLASMCANKPEDSELWTEFLRRFTPHIKLFIQMTLKQYAGSKSSLSASFDLIQGSSDLLQNTVLRLVQNDCAALKRFSGTTESQLLAYLAVIARSAVRDFVRLQSARKRFHWLVPTTPEKNQQSENSDSSREPVVEDPIERKVLAGEVEQLSLQTIRDHSSSPTRDTLIFQLYFGDGLSIAQIAACKGIGLSKTGVEKMLNRLKDTVRTKAGIYPVEARS